ncbi:class V aminotransferase [Schinkia azotoformans LMG 9581]|uniref:cysteine desulfurase n=2 Tax=Schinkia azotoformans TaxID=1454 RepID=K6D9Z8_SCHAZ|nr:class V aminotransferase [Schinkia azotoformans LMG 9581]
MMDCMVNTFGNPSSIHSFGRQARHIIDDARAFIAKSINASENEIIFTSGGTEADNTALFGVAMANKEKGNHIITTSIEHHAILHTCNQLEKEGFEITYLPVNEFGEINLDALKAAITESTILVSIMYGNNEVGTIQPIKEIGELLSDSPIIFHSDAVQAYGTQLIDVKDLHLDLMSVSAHKIKGPKGIGFLYAKNGIKFVPRQYGGEQERKRRAGTENVAGIAGFKEAVRLAHDGLQGKIEKYEQFKHRMASIFEQEKIQFEINGEGAKSSLPHVLNISFSGTNVESMLVNLDLAGIAASSGSACTAGSIEPSHVLVAMFGNESSRTTNSIRFSFGFENTLDEIEKAALSITKIVKKITER